MRPRQETAARHAFDRGHTRSTRRATRRGFERSHDMADRGFLSAKDEVSGQRLAATAAMRSLIARGGLHRPCAPASVVQGGAASAATLAPYAPMLASKKEKSLGDILKKAGNRALGGGAAGALSMVVNVSALMWMRTTINFQYRYGMSTTEAFRHLYKDGGGGIGGVTRFYRGYFAALLQGPLSRFGDTAANTGFLALCDEYESTKNLPAYVKTMGASAAAAGMRIFLMPIDAWKTTKQVEGAEGLKKLMGKVRSNGPQVLWHGGLGAASATYVGHYPWFAVYNSLNEYLPQYDRKTDFFMYLGRNALIGFCASATSDSISNPIRVLKTYRQTSTEKVSYIDAAKAVIAKEGFAGFWTRGLSTKIIANGMQGIMFSIGYKYFQELILGK